MATIIPMPRSSLMQCVSAGRNTKFECCLLRHAWWFATPGCLLPGTIGVVPQL